MGTMIVDQLWHIVAQAARLSDIIEDIVIPISWGKRPIDSALIEAADATQSLIDGAVSQVEEYLAKIEREETP